MSLSECHLVVCSLNWGRLAGDFKKKHQALLAQSSFFSSLVYSCGSMACRHDMQALVSTHSRQVVVISLTRGASSSLVKTCLPHTCKQLQNRCAGMVEEQRNRLAHKGRCYSPLQADAQRRAGRGSRCECL